MKRIICLIFFVFLLAGTVSADIGAADTGMMNSIIPSFHILEIAMAIGVALLVYPVVKATAQEKIFVYIPISMGFFVVGSIVGYSPHLGLIQAHVAEFAVLIMNTLALAILGVSFYKWKKLL